MARLFGLSRSLGGGPAGGPARVGRGLHLVDAGVRRLAPARAEGTAAYGCCRKAPSPRRRERNDAR